MAFVDEIKIHAGAGRGGNGVARWLHEKGKEFGGASGGNGGKGGDVYIRAVRDIGILARYRNIKEFVAENGQAGMRNSMHGKNGEDFVIDLPVGSVVTNLKSDKRINLEEEGQTFKILEGGRGGIGNEHFKSSTNLRPKEWTPGKDGETGDLLVELEMFADLGLVGLPNAGKSSLLNAVTNASVKVGSYAFTTLEPNLGTMYGYIIADIPGLIEGASEGKGLGHKFLRHIKRTKVLLHCLSCEETDLLKPYDTIREELKAYGNGLDEKAEIIILTKSDVVSDKELEERKKILMKKNKNIMAVSILDDASLKKFQDDVIKFLRK